MTDQDDIEAMAKAIYESWPFLAAVPWVVNGNSNKQNDARTYACAALAALRALGWQKVGPEQVVVPVEPVNPDQQEAVDSSLDWIDAEANKWAIECNIMEMAANVAEVARLSTGVPQNVRESFAKRAREQIHDLCLMSFTEAWIRCMDGYKYHRAAIAAKDAK